MSEPTLPTPPPFSALPLDPTGPPGNAWGLYDSNNTNSTTRDCLGQLNLLTPSNTLRAAQEEIRTGVRVSLDWTLDKPAHPSFNRNPFKRTFITKHPRCVNDDVLEFNTQCSSQWDGFRHYAYQNERKFYNNRTIQDFEESPVMGIDAWAENGGIVGRGILLDFADHVRTHNLPYSPLSSDNVPISTLKSLAASLPITFRSGDILFVRSGFTAAYNQLPASEEIKIHERTTPQFGGIQACEETLQWFWENQFAAVAGDAPSLERAPIDKADDPRFMLHQWMLAGWGMPIGEMFDLERLAEECRKQQRWSFFVSSVPLKVPGGVASPPNAVAIF